MAACVGHSENSLGTPGAMRDLQTTNKEICQITTSILTLPHDEASS